MIIVTYLKKLCLNTHSRVVIKSAYSYITDNITTCGIYIVYQYKVVQLYFFIVNDSENKLDVCYNIRYY